MQRVCYFTVNKQKSTNSSVCCIMTVAEINNDLETIKVFKSTLTGTKGCLTINHRGCSSAGRGSVMGCEYCMYHGRESSWELGMVPRHSLAAILSRWPLTVLQPKNSLPSKKVFSPYKRHISTTVTLLYYECLIYEGFTFVEFASSQIQGIYLPDFIPM